MSTALKTKPKPLPNFLSLALKSGAKWAIETYVADTSDYVEINVQSCGEEDPRPYLKVKWNLKPVREDLAFKFEYLEDYNYLEVSKALTELSGRYLTSIREGEHLIATALLNLLAQMYRTTDKKK